VLSKSKLQQILALKQKKIRERWGQFLIEGFRLCEEALQSDFEIHACFCQKENLKPEAFERVDKLAAKKKIEIIDIDAADVNRIADTVHSQGIFCIVRQKQYSLDNFLAENPAFLLLIDAGQDPGNVGTLIRTADWFGFNGVILGKDSVEPYNAKVVRATMGSFFHLPVFSDVDLSTFLAILKRKNFQTISADVHGKKFYHQLRYSAPLALILGNENQGISREISRAADYQIRIPAFGRAESLNLAQAGAVIMSQIRISEAKEQ